MMNLDILKFPVLSETFPLSISGKLEAIDRSPIIIPFPLVFVQQIRF